MTLNKSFKPTAASQRRPNSGAMLLSDFIVTTQSSVTLFLYSPGIEHAYEQ